MSVTWAGQRDVGTTSARWQSVVDRLARYGWLVLLVAVVVALVGGMVYVVTWEPRALDAQVAVPGRDACPDPPCFDRGDLQPGLRDLPAVIPVLGYLLAIALGLPSLLTAAWDFLRGLWRAGIGRLLVLVGPMLFLVGTEIVPHLFNPCYFALELAGKRLPEFYCAYSPDWGADLADRWHPLGHALVGALPMAALYWLALRRLRPDIASFPRIYRR